MKLLATTQHYCSSECPDSKAFEEHDYQLKEAQRKILLRKDKEKKHEKIQQ